MIQFLGVFMTIRRSYFATTALGAGVLLAALAGPASATDQATPAKTCAPNDTSCQTDQTQTGQSTTPPPAAESTEVNEVVVTGSRIKTTTFSSPAPLTVITAEQAELTGQVDTSQILQLSTVAANAVQINNFFSGFVTTGGPGANTLSLRGLGSQRTLFLINGERVGPAGVGGTVGPFDLNVIPESMIDHIDILKDGASSIYGSDAVAGVVNLVTKTNEDGIDLHAHFEPSQDGGGDVYQLNGSWGKTFDKGYITAGFDYYRQNALLVGQRSYLDCAQDQVTFANGAPADLIDPATGQSKCQNISIANSVVDAGVIFQEYISNPQAVAGGNSGFDLNGWQAVGVQYCGGTNATNGTPCLLSGGPINVAQTRNSAAILPTTSPLTNLGTAISPVSRYTFSLFGGYDLAPHAQLYGSILLNQRDSAQDIIDQFFVEPVNLSAATQNQLGNNGLASLAFGVPVNGFVYPIPVIMQQAPSTQTVDYARIVLGVKGDLPSWGSFKNWTYDVFGQESHDWGSYSQLFSKSDRVSATAGAPDGTCDPTSTAFSNESMAQLEPGIACVPVNYLQAVVNGGFTPAEAAFLYSNEYGHTTYDQAYVDGSMTGDIFQLPAGPLGGALGAQLRYEAIDDVPGPDFVDQNVYHFSTTGVTKGSEYVEEVYGELKVPVVKDLPLVYSLDADLSGRFSNYSSYGSNVTYKGTIDWRVTDWFTVRGTYGTAFRAPALYELYLANQVSFLNELGLDPCVNYLTQPGLPQIIRTNCANPNVPANLGGGAVSPTYTGSGAGAEILAGGGVGHLKAETSIADTVGFVFQPKWWGLDLNVAVDYYNYDIQNQIQQFGAANILYQCYSASDFPNNPFCSLFTRNSPNATDNPSNVTVVNDDYVNVAKEIDQGMDIDIRYRTQLPRDVKLTIESSLAWTFYTNTILLGGQVNNYLGSIGYPTFVGNVDWRFDKGPWTFNWYLYLLNSGNDDQFTSNVIPNYNQTGQTVYANYKTPFYTLSDVSVRRKFDKFTVELGVKNLFNQSPPDVSTDDTVLPFGRAGNVPNISQYDLIGRTFYFDIDAKF
jgi:iron complex outermembrane recepter protein